MRKLVPSKQIKGLAKLNNNIVVNDEGTQVEIGGNVALESIEQLGTIIDVPQSETKTLDIVAGNKYKVNQNAEYLSATTKYFKPVAGTVKASPTGTTEGPVFGPFDEGDVGNIVMSSDFGITAYITGWDPDNSYCLGIQCVNSSGYLEFVAAQSTTVTDADYKNHIWEVVDEHQEFAPFFTEEQYAALLALIQNA